MKERKTSQMYNRCFWLFVMLTISWLKHASSTYTFSSKNINLPFDVLTKSSCPSDGIPVCGVRYKQFFLFPNDCLLKEVNKDLLLDNTSFKKIPLKYCLDGCQFLCSKKYQPICGKNVITGKHQLFDNQCKVIKYTCQTSVEYIKINLSECEETNQFMSSTKYVKKRSQIKKRIPIPCTNILRPVCGIYMGVKSSFKNECLLNEENVKFNRDWRVVKNGMCAEDYANTRQKQVKSIKPHLVKKRSLDSNFHDQFNQYLIKNVEESKISSGVIPNNLYLYMPPAFQTQYLNYESNNYHQSVPLQKAYDEIYNKIVALPQIHSEHAIVKEENEERNKFAEPFHRENRAKPVPFDANGMNFNYVPDISQTIHEVSSQSKDTELNGFLSDTDSVYQYTFKNPNYNIELEEKTPNMTPTSLNLSYTTEISEVVFDTTVIPNTFKHTKEEKIYEKTNEKECKFGLNAICGIMTNGTVQSFDTICEMITANINLKNTWVKLHDGVCETCTYNCSREYKPICVTRNGVNYTMINNCYFNMGICMDKKSKWKKLTDGKCERYTRIPDKYANSKPGFFYTSDYFVTDMISTMAMSSPTLPTSTDKSLELKSRRIKKRRPNPKRAINRRTGLCRCSSRSHCCNSLSYDKLKCKCGHTTRKTTPTRMASYGPQTESYIMRLVQNKTNQ